VHIAIITIQFRVSEALYYQRTYNYYYYYVVHLQQLLLLECPAYVRDPASIKTMTWTLIQCFSTFLLPRNPEPA